jgi:uncharacterized membrane protein YdjX (TVP38/TMEM64 family)
MPALLATGCRRARLSTAAVGLAVFFLAGFLVVEAAGVPWLSAPPSLQQWAGPIAAVVAVGLLVGDAVLPVPAGVVVLALGSVFGAPLGAALALAGRSGGTLLSFAIGRRLGPRIGDRDGRAERMLRRWGVLAIVVTRPVPIIGETTAVLAGASAMTWRAAALGAVAGSLPEAVLLTWAGTQAGDVGIAVAVGSVLVATAVLVQLLRSSGGLRRSAPARVRR